MKYIYQHLGLGDSIVCNALIRNIVKNNDNYTLFVKPENRASIEFMFKDLKNLFFIEGDDFFANNFLNNIDEKDIYVIGFMYGEYKKWNDFSKNFETVFYEQHNLDIQKKWDDFKCERDHKKELEIYNHFNLNKTGDYIFVHDDSRFNIDPSKIKSELRIIKPIVGLTKNIFDYCMVIENAKEVHAIESSFAFIIDQMNLNDFFIIHRYPRWQNSFGIPEYKNVKHIIE